jgi:hypothetical protein
VVCGTSGRVRELVRTRRAAPRLARWRPTPSGRRYRWPPPAASGCLAGAGLQGRPPAAAGTRTRRHRPTGPPPRRGTRARVYPHAYVRSQRIVPHHHEAPMRRLTCMDDVDELCLTAGDQRAEEPSGRGIEPHPPRHNCRSEALSHVRATPTGNRTQRYPTETCCGGRAGWRDHRRRQHPERRHRPRCVVTAVVRQGRHAAQVRVHEVLGQQMHRRRGETTRRAQQLISQLDARLRQHVDDPSTSLMATSVHRALTVPARHQPEQPAGGSAPRTPEGWVELPALLASIMDSRWPP